MIQMVVFDMAGTTVWDGDNAVASALCEALRNAGADVSIADVDPVMGIPKPQAIRTLLGRLGPGDTDEGEVGRIHADFQARIVEHYRTSPDVREMDGASEVFATLRGMGVRVTLDTGFDRTILDAIVERLGWSGLLDDTVSSDEVEQGRPAPDMIRVLMERAGITDPSMVAKIGDAESDIEQGVNARCGLVGAMLCGRTRAVLDRFPTAQPVSSLREFLRLVEHSDGVTV